MSEINGALLVDKPAGMTSHDVVAKIRKLYGTKQVGHTGTLDPMATGLLVILLGRAVKASELLVCGHKTYRAGLRLGITTDTEDITGKILTESTDIPQKEKVFAAAKTFSGEIMQTPPMYSAKKTGGHKLVDLARAGVTIPREACKINIYSIEISGDGADYTLDVECSAGTYIRTLCADIGNILGCGGVMSSLIRLKTGGFDISESHTFQKIEAMSMDERRGLLKSPESLFPDMPKVSLPDFYAGLCKNGCEIYQRKIGTGYKCGELVQIYDKEGFLGIGLVGDFSDGSAIKLKKLLR